MRQLKTADFFALRGEFDPSRSRWNRRKRDQKATQLEAVIAKHALCGVALAIDMAMFRDLELAKGLGKDGDPFQFCFPFLLSGMLNLVTYLRKPGIKVAMYYDSQRGGNANSRALQLFDEEVREAKSSWLQGVYAGSDDHLPELQAADLLAWRNRRKLIGAEHRPDLFIEIGEITQMHFRLRESDLLKAKRIIEARRARRS